MLASHLAPCRCFDAEKLAAAEPAPPVKASQGPEDPTTTTVPATTATNTLRPATRLSEPLLPALGNGPILESLRNATNTLMANATSGMGTGLLDTPVLGRGPRAAVNATAEQDRVVVGLLER